MAGMLMSINEEIDRLRFVRFPTRAASAAKVVRIDKLIVALLSNGEIAVDRNMEGFAYPATTAFTWMDELIQAVHRLGVISKAAMDEHLALCRKNAERQSRRYAAESLLRAADTLSLTLTDEQTTVIAAAEPRRHDA